MRFLLLCLTILPLTGCFVIRGSSGGGEVSEDVMRRFEPTDIALPEGYEITLIASGLTYPTGIAFDETTTRATVASVWSVSSVACSSLARLGARSDV